MLSGRTPVFFRSFRNKRIAALVLRRFWTRTSRTSPSSSTARQSHIRFPEIFTTISSRCQRPVGLWSGSAKVLSEKSAEFERPASNGFVVRLDPTLGQHLLDVAQTQGESEIQPNGLSDHVGREPVPFERDCLHGHSPNLGAKLPPNRRNISVCLTGSGCEVCRETCIRESSALVSASNPLDLTE